MWIVCLALVASCLIIVDTIRLGISPMPTSRKVRKSLFSMLPTKFDKTIYELGSGFGFLALKLARRYPNAKVVAFEKAVIPCLVSKFRSLFVKNLTVYYEDFFQVDLTKADLLISYLFPGAMKRLAKKHMHGELFSHTFRLPGFKPSQVVKSHDLYHTEIFRYSFD